MEQQYSEIHFAKEGLNIQFTQEHHYVGGFTGSNTMKLDWLQPTIQQWVTNVEILSKVAAKHLQSAYTALTYSLQAEWQ